MSIDLGKFGIWTRTADATTELALEVEALGYGALWVGGSPNGELAEIETVLGATQHIAVATGIVNMWRDDAATVADSYLRINSRFEDRFLLGVGIGHPESTAEYSSPYETMVSYIGALAGAGVPRDHMVLAALGPRSLRLAAETTAGSHPYLTTPRHTRFARDLLGEDVLIAPEQTVVIEANAVRAREISRKFVSRYLRLVNYRSSLLREGWTENDLDDDGSDRLVDELVLAGDPSEIAEGIRAHLDAGADHVTIQVLGDDARAGYRALAGELL